MQSKRFEKILTVLQAMERAETAQLKAKMTEIATMRNTAKRLRIESATQSPLATAAEMLFQSQHQQADEARARQLEQDADVAQLEAREIQGKLALTLGREQAAEMLAKEALKIEQEEHERRTEAVPVRKKSYLSASSEPSSVGTE